MLEDDVRAEVVGRLEGLGAHGTPVLADDRLEAAVAQVRAQQRPARLQKAAARTVGHGHVRLQLGRRRAPLLAVATPIVRLMLIGAARSGNFLLLQFLARFLVSLQRALAGRFQAAPPALEGAVCVRRPIDGGNGLAAMDARFFALVTRQGGAREISAAIVAREFFLEVRLHLLGRFAFHAAIFAFDRRGCFGLLGVAALAPVAGELIAAPELHAAGAHLLRLVARFFPERFQFY